MHVRLRLSCHPRCRVHTLRQLQNPLPVCQYPALFQRTCRHRVHGYTNSRPHSTGPRYNAEDGRVGAGACVCVPAPLPVFRATRRGEILRQKGLGRGINVTELVAKPDLNSHKFPVIMLLSIRKNPLPSAFFGVLRNLERLLNNSFPANRAFSDGWNVLIRQFWGIFPQDPSHCSKNALRCQVTPLEIAYWWGLSFSRVS